MVTACGKDSGKENNGDDNNNEQIETPWTVTDKISGEITAGYATSIRIAGSDFDPDEDYIYIGWEENGETTYALVSNAVLTLRKNRIEIGVPVTAPYIDKAVKVYLERLSFDAKKHALTDNLTFVMPAVSEGYIPDAGFRATLQSTHSQDGNPNFAGLFDAYGMLDAAAAAKVEKCGVESYGLNLYACTASSLAGIELFSGITGTIAGWNLPNLVETDLSAWKAQGIGANFNGNAGLRKFTAPPYATIIALYNCPALEYVDLSTNRWCYFPKISASTTDEAVGKTNVKYLDMRRQRTGVKHDYNDTASTEGRVPDNVAADDYAIFRNEAYFLVADGCEIHVEYAYLTEKKQATYANGERRGYLTIYDAWVNGATIHVYDSADITRKIGTVPMYGADNGALTESGANGWTPTGY